MPLDASNEMLCGPLPGRPWIPRPLNDVVPFLLALVTVAPNSSAPPSRSIALNSISLANSPRTTDPYQSNTSTFGCSGAKIFLSSVVILVNDFVELAEVTTEARSDAPGVAISVPYAASLLVIKLMSLMKGFSFPHFLSSMFSASGSQSRHPPPPWSALFLLHVVAASKRRVVANEANAPPEPSTATLD